MNATRTERAHPLAGPGLTMALLLPVGILLIAGLRAAGMLNAILLAAILIAISIPVLGAEAGRQASRGLFWLLVIGLALKLVGALARHYVAFDVYEGVADAAGYHDWGVKLSERFREGIFTTGLEDHSGTNFIRLLTGIVYTLIGPSQIGGFLVFSWLGFWGLFAFFRAFVIAVPKGRVQSYGRMVFLLPSLVFWSSSLGKEAWMTFALGTVSLGVAYLLTGRSRGLLLVGAGLWAAGVVRPHVAGLIAIALAAGYLFYRSRSEHRQLAPMAKILALTVLAVIATVLVLRTEAFLQESGFDTEGGVEAVQTDISGRTGQGDSKFEPSLVKSPIRAPIAFFTILFRPLLSEAHNPRALISALEATFLLLLTIIRFRWIRAAIGNIKRQPYVAFALAYTVLFVVAFSGVANFGLLARQRVQLLPLYLVLLSVPALGSTRPKKTRSSPVNRERATVGAGL